MRPVSTIRRSNATYSSKESKAVGIPVFGSPSNILARADASPVSKPFQNGEFADSASMTGRCQRSSLAIQVAFVRVIDADVDVQAGGDVAVLRVLDPVEL